MTSNGKEIGETTQIAGLLKLKKKQDGRMSTTVLFTCALKTYRSISIESKSVEFTMDITIRLLRVATSLAVIPFLGSTLALLKMDITTLVLFKLMKDASQLMRSMSTRMFAL